MKETKSPVGFRKQLIIGVLLINLAIIVLVGISIRQSRFQYEERAAITTQNLSHALEEYINGVITKTDVALLSVVDEAERQLASGGINRRAINAYIIRHRGRIPEIDGLRMTNAQGDILYGTDVAPGVNVSDRDFFIHLRNELKPGLFISKPMVSRITRNWVIIISRRYNHPNGSFAGEIHGVVSLNSFSKTFSRINVGKHGIIVLLDNDRSVICRYTETNGTDSSIGKKYTSSEIQELFRRGETSATYRTRSNIDGVYRTHSYRRVSSYPIYVVVGLANDDYLAQWRNDVTKLLTLVVLFICVTLWMACMLYRYIIARQSAEKALIESEKFLQTIIETEPECIKLLDANGTLLQMNRAGLSMIGADSLEQVKGKCVYALVTEEYREAFKSLTEDVFRGRSGTLAFEMVGLKGRHVWLETYSVPLRNEKDAIIASLGITRDATERKKMEEELLKSRKLEAVAILSKGIAHDFNNMLTSVLGFISLSKALVPPSDQVHKYLSTAETACVRAKELTHQLDEFASGGTLERKASSLVRLLQDSSGLLSTNVNFKVNISVPDNLWPAEIDERQIFQVMQGLIQNASEAMPDGGVIDIVAKNTVISSRDLLPLQEGRYIKISVKDHGVGIAKENLLNIFEPYFTTKQMDYRSGVGFGLALCYSIVKGHKGYIAVASEPEKGTVLDVYLPASPDKNEQIDPPPNQSTPG